MGSHRDNAFSSARRCARARGLQSSRFSWWHVVQCSAYIILYQFMNADRDARRSLQAECGGNVGCGVLVHFFDSARKQSSCYRPHTVRYCTLLTLTHADLFAWSSLLPLQTIKLVTLEPPSLTNNTPNCAHQEGLRKTQYSGCRQHADVRFSPLIYMLRSLTESVQAQGSLAEIPHI